MSHFAMFLTINNFARVKRAALFAARIAVGADVSSGDGGIAIVRQNRALSLPSPNAPLVSDAVST